MRKITILTTIILFYSNIYGLTPLSIDAGKDTSYCFEINFDSDFNFGNYFSIKLGGNPTAKGGTAPYTYSWNIYSKTTKKQIVLITDSLNNAANPNFKISKSYDLNYWKIDTLNDVFIFKLTVTDSNGQSAQDSSTIMISRFGNTINYTGGIQYPCMEVYTKDSIQIGPCGISGGIPPFSSFHWTPEYGLSDPNIQNPKAVLLNGYSYMNYGVTFMDTAGCVLKAGFVITDIKNGDLKTGFVSYKNPVSNSGSMNFTTELLGSKLQIVSASGIIQYQTKVENESIPLGSLISTTGIYYYTLTTPIGTILSGSFIRE